MRVYAIALLMLGCTPLPVPVPGEPPPVYTPRPVPLPIVVPSPSLEPTPSPTPEPEVTMPAVVSVGQAFVVQYCGPDFSERVSILFDSKYPAGGFMGWSEDCKRQTITGLNTPGKRYFQFVVDGDVQPVRYYLIVE